MPKLQFFLHIAMMTTLVANGPLAAQPASHLTPLRSLQLPSDTRAGRPPVVTSVALSRDGQLLAAAGDDHVVRIFNLHDGQLLHTLRGHLDWVRTVSFSPDGGSLASAGDDHQIHVWDTASGQSLSRLTDHNQPVYCLCYSPDGSKLASVGFDKEMRLYDADGDARAMRLGTVVDCPCRDMRAVAYSPDGRLMAAAGRNGRLRVWETATSNVVLEREDHDRRVRALAFSEDSTILASAGDGPQINVMDVRTGQPLFSMPCRPGRVLSMVFCGPDRLATGGSDNAIRIWNLQTRVQQMRLTGHTGSVGALAYDAASALLVSGSYDTTLRVWRLAEDRPEETTRTNSSPLAR